MKSPIAPILLEPHLGELPGSSRRISRNDAATGASAAGVRALSAQMVAFYFRAPIKAFFRMRVEYVVSVDLMIFALTIFHLMRNTINPSPALVTYRLKQVFARAVNPRVAEGKWSLHTTTPGLLLHAVRTYGWRFIPNQVLPPLMANAGVGAVLYTSYLQVLGALHEPVSQGVKRVWPPAPPFATFTAGFTAGTIQSIVAAPLDALQVRFRTNDMLKDWFPGVFAGWSLSFMRDSLGYAVFFSSFEYIKSQSYYSFITWYYGSLQVDHVDKLSSSESSDRGVPLIKPHYALEPCFLMMAGVVASIAQQTIQHPLSRIQDLHLGRLEYLDHQASLIPSRQKMIRLYYHAYQETFKRCKRKAVRAGGWRSWLFRGFVGSSLRQVPSTSAGLIIFELSPATTSPEWRPSADQYSKGYAQVSLTPRLCGEPLLSISFPSPHSFREGCEVQPNTAIISPTSSTRASNIPLRSLPSDSRSTHSGLLESNEKGSRRSSHSSARSVGSDFSIWSDTGDLAEQFTETEDPLHIHLRDSSDRRLLRRKDRKKQPKNVHYSSDLSNKSSGVDIEKIKIPNPPPRHISRVERVLAAIMTPRNEPRAQMHGLVGKPLLYFTSVFVSLGVFLFGYDQGVMSGIITGWYFTDYFNKPSRATIGTVVAVLEIGALISSLLVGRVGDVIGRRRTILYGSIVFFIGGAFQAFATGIPMMMVGRVIAGLGVGALSTIVPVYQSEISPPHNRGKLACIEFTGNIAGYATSVWVDYFCSFIDSDYSWRLPLLFQCVMGALLGIGSLMICESPRWLLDNDHDEEGMVVIANLYGEGDLLNDKARQEYREIKMNVLVQRQEGERSYSDMFRRYRKRVLIAMSAQALAQLNGINVISYYAPLVFEQAGWAGRDAILMTGINGISYLLSTIPPWYLVDGWGRRPILLSGAVAMLISLSLISYFIYIEIPATPTLTVIFVMLYNAAFGASWGPIPWLYPPGDLAFEDHYTDYVTSVYFLYPETSGVRLEDMNVLFGDASTAMPTPATQGERGSLMGAGSPVPSLDLRRQYGQFGAESSIPGLDIDPPTSSHEGTSKRGRSDSHQGSARGEGIGGWISSMVTRNRGAGPDATNSQYRRLEQGEGDEQ
ncbi:Mitochondrial substrate/solute carrier [Penicillium coprophilum]|uniref:Mitochondrial substrate/solute carrier n=1 Tax=Penicillium coprophilum TaxID=36646 RepID=UPI0023900BAD|nr:Mitochondrial substrate/solute carrier [Penicillium coprophilum]KAJ5164712.1 Mitochondrial substrate/solute carrier [Penicillium coprophilum]